MSRSRTFYVCGVDYLHELGEVPDYVKAYTSESDLRRQTECWKNCGIVEITVDESNIKWLHPQDLDNGDTEGNSDVE